METNLHDIAKQSAENLESLIKESSDQIIEAWSKCAEEALLNDSKPKLKLGFLIALDVDKNKFTNRLSWTVTTSREVEGSVDDHQPKLPGVEE